MYGGKQIISLREMSIYRLLIHRFAVPLPSQGKAHEETQLTDKLQFTKNTAPKEAVLQCKVENQTFIFPDHSKSLMNRPPMTVRFWKWM